MVEVLRNLIGEELSKHRGLLAQGSHCIRILEASVSFRVVRLDGLWLTFAARNLAEETEEMSSANRFSGLLVIILGVMTASQEQRVVKRREKLDGKSKGAERRRERGLMSSPLHARRPTGARGPSPIGDQLYAESRINTPYHEVQATRRLPYQSAGGLKFTPCQSLPGVRGHCTHATRDF